MYMSPLGKNFSNTHMNMYTHERERGGKKRVGKKEEERKKGCRVCWAGSSRRLLRGHDLKEPAGAHHFFCALVTLGKVLSQDSF